MNRFSDQKFVSTVNFYETYGMTSSWPLPRVGCICIARKRYNKTKATVYRICYK